MKKRITMAAALLLALASASLRAGEITYSFSWTGDMGYSMTGMFSFPASKAGEDRIDETELTMFMMTVLLNGVPQVGYLPNKDDLENFAFDPVAEMLGVGGGPDTATGQRWNASACCVTGWGFQSGGTSQFLRFDHVQVADSLIRTNVSTLKAWRKVPVPASLWLFGLGLVALGAWRRSSRV